MKNNTITRDDNWKAWSELPQDLEKPFISLSLCLEKQAKPMFIGRQFELTHSFNSDITT